MNLSRYLQHLVEADLGISPLPESFERSGAPHSKAVQQRQERQTGIAG